VALSEDFLEKIPICVKEKTRYFTVLIAQKTGSTKFVKIDVEDGIDAIF